MFTRGSCYLVVKGKAELVCKYGWVMVLERVGDDSTWSWNGRLEQRLSVGGWKIDQSDELANFQPPNQYGIAPRQTQSMPELTRLDDASWLGKFLICLGWV